ncbi:hypothetical protein Agub_g12210 [Astrephomene gubernaculifera]|uniref:Uncharacterized protein n=1 Tax=Astrephomene gubernaculifera TaxID=47775 RepID=A0AAD3DY84_9CHLO|nr:hypothetical protein Agub_g12210 [Astrephomene gubernaculifera]
MAACCSAGAGVAPGRMRVRGEGGVGCAVARVLSDVRKSARTCDVTLFGCPRIKPSMSLLQTGRHRYTYCPHVCLRRPAPPRRPPLISPTVDAGSARVWRVAAVAALASVVHAFGLFSANWIQGEGRILSWGLAAAGVLLWLHGAVLGAATTEAEVAPEATPAAGAEGNNVFAAAAMCLDDAGGRVPEQQRQQQRQRPGQRQQQQQRRPAAVLPLLATSCTAGSEGGGGGCPNRVLGIPGLPQPLAAMQSPPQCEAQGTLQVQPPPSPPPPSASPPPPPQQQQRHQPPSRSRRRRQLRVQSWSPGVVLLAVALLCNAALQHYSLIDRWGSDPHDKRQLATAGTPLPAAPVAAAAAAAAKQPSAAAAAAVEQAGAVESPSVSSTTATPDATTASAAAAANVSLALAAVETLLPLALLPLFLAAVRHWLVQLHPFTATAAAEETSACRTGMHAAPCKRQWQPWRWQLWWLGVAPYPLIAAWWALQLLPGGGSSGSGGGGASVSLEVLVRTAVSVTRDLRLSLLQLLPSPPSLLRQLMTVVIAPYSAPLRVVQALTGAFVRTVVMQRAYEWMVAFVVRSDLWRLPLRLLLPRVVYGITVTALLQLVFVRVAHSVGGITQQARLRRRRCNEHRPPVTHAGGSPEVAAADRDVGSSVLSLQADVAEEATCTACTAAATPTEAVAVAGENAASPDVVPSPLLRRRLQLLDAGHALVCNCTAIVVLLLGRKGPAIMLLLWAHGTALLGLLLQQAPAACRPSHSCHGHHSRCEIGGGKQGADEGPVMSPSAPVATAAAAEEGEHSAGDAGTMHAGTALTALWRLEQPPPPPAAAAVQAAPLEAAAGCLLALLGSHAFFLTGHFCEFSGLQYDSPFVGFERMTWLVTPALFAANSFGGLLLSALALPLVAEAVAAAAAAAGTEAAAVMVAGTTATSAAAWDSCDGNGAVLDPSKGDMRRETGNSGSGGGVAGAGVAGPGTAVSDTPAPFHSPSITFIPSIPPAVQSHSSSSTGVVALLSYSAVRSLCLCTTILSAAVQRRHVVVWALFGPKLVFEVGFAAAGTAALLLVAGLWLR